MKWTKKGHQFDEIAEKFNGKKKIYIYGAGQKGAELCRYISFIGIDGFIDQNSDKQKNGYMGYPVFSFEALLTFPKDHIVIVAATELRSTSMLQKLIMAGYQECVDCFTYQRFVDWYLPIYAVYEKDMVYIPSVSCITTTVCNLKCKHCLNFTIYNSHKKHASLEQLKANADALFNVADFVGKFHISGGEPQLFPYLADFIDYVGSKYRKQIADLVLVTNGTIVPDDSLCQIITKHNVFVELDDYTGTLGGQEILSEVQEKLQKYNIKYVVLEAGIWIDLAPMETDNSNMSEKQMIDYFDACGVPYSQLIDESITSCNYESFAHTAGLIGRDENNYFNLRRFKPEQKKELIEFRMGYTEKGYVDFCRRCAGFATINPNKVKAAQQA